MSPIEALIIYLSAGAPFGVLVFFSRRVSKRISTAYALLATIGWPLVGAHRLYRSLSRTRLSRSRIESARASQEDMTGLLERLSSEVPTETAELFTIAGHPNPWLATNVYARSRRRVVASHLDRLGSSHFDKPALSRFNGDTFVREVEPAVAASLVT